MSSTLVALAQRGVGLAVGDVGPEAAVLHHDRLARGGVGAELAQRRRGRGLAAPPLRLGEDPQRLVERAVNSWSSVGEAAAVGALLDVGPVAAVLRGDLGAVGRVGADDAGQRQQAQRIVEGEGVERHVLEQRRRARLLLGRRRPSRRAGRRARTARPWRTPGGRCRGRCRARRSPWGASSSSRAWSTVSSSGARSSGTDAVSSPRFR